MTANVLVAAVTHGGANLVLGTGNSASDSRPG